MQLKAILLDKDGTLIDFDKTCGPAAYEAMLALSRGDRGRLEALMEVSHYLEAERRFLPSSPLVAGSSAHYGPMWAHALGRAPGAEFYGEMDELFRVHGLRTLSPIGRPDEVLRALAGRGYRLGIATNDAEASARSQAEALGLTGLLDLVVGYDSGFGPKPHPGQVTAFARHLGLGPGEVALVGDSLHDLHAARAAGSVAIAVLTGPLGEAARAQIAPHADHVVASIADLPVLLDRLAAAA